MPETEQVTERRKDMLELVVRVAVLEDRMERVQTDLKSLADRLEAAVKNIEESVESIRDRPNAVTEFLAKNWKVLIVVGAAFMGANATVLDMLQRVLLNGG